MYSRDTHSESAEPVPSELTRGRASGYNRTSVPCSECHGRVIQLARVLLTSETADSRPTRPIQESWLNSSTHYCSANTHQTLSPTAAAVGAHTISAVYCSADQLLGIGERVAGRETNTGESRERERVSVGACVFLRSRRDGFSASRSHRRGDCERCRYRLKTL